MTCPALAERAQQAKHRRIGGHFLESSQQPRRQPSLLYYLHFTFEETEIRQLKWLAQGHTGGKQQGLEEAHANLGTYSNITKNVWESELSLG